MPTKAVYLLVVSGFADWEPAHALAELRRHGQYRVEVVGLSPESVESMGGLLVQRLGRGGTALAISGRDDMRLRALARRLDFPVDLRCAPVHDRAALPRCPGSRRW